MRGDARRTAFPTGLPGTVEERDTDRIRFRPFGRHFQHGCLEGSRLASKGPGIGDAVEGCRCGVSDYVTRPTEDFAQGDPDVLAYLCRWHLTGFDLVDTYDQAANRTFERAQFSTAGAASATS